MVKVPDGVNGDFTSFRGVVGIAHKSSLDVKFLHDYSILLNIYRELKNAFSLKVFSCFDFLTKVKFEIKLAPATYWTLIGFIFSFFKSPYPAPLY